MAKKSKPAKTTTYTSFRCRICGCNDFTWPQLQQHFKDNHPGEKP